MSIIAILLQLTSVLHVPQEQSRIQVCAPLALRNCFCPPLMIEKGGEFFEAIDTQLESTNAGRVVGGRDPAQRQSRG
jgi:hypothetical protein